MMLLVAYLLAVPTEYFFLRCVTFPPVSNNAPMCKGETVMAVKQSSTRPLHALRGILTVLASGHIPAVPTEYFFPQYSAFSISFRSCTDVQWNPSSSLQAELGLPEAEATLTGVNLEVGYVCNGSSSSES